MGLTETCSDEWPEWCASLEFETPTSCSLGKCSIPLTYMTKLAGFMGESILIRWNGKKLYEIKWDYMKLDDRMICQSDIKSM